jgi:SAM-dependent methyltransferase
MKWLIPEDDGPEFDTPRRPDEEYWHRSHLIDDYADVFSVSEDPGLQSRIIEIIKSKRSPAEDIVILIPGCGSRMALERHLSAELPRAQIVGTDFAPVVEMLNAGAGDHPSISYQARDTQDLGYQSQFDFAVVINSILSNSDRRNRTMISSVYNSLKHGGHLIGLFPTIFATIDIAQCEPNERWRERLYDIRTSRYYEETQQQSQIFYTPLRLRRILGEAGFEDLRIELFFCDSERLLRESSRIYRLDGADLALYEFLIKARKPEVDRSGGLRPSAW